MWTHLPETEQLSSVCRTRRRRRGSEDRAGCHFVGSPSWYLLRAIRIGARTIMPHEETVVLEVGAIWVPFTCKPAIMWAVEVHYIDFI